MKSKTRAFSLLTGLVALLGWNQMGQAASFKMACNKADQTVVVGAVGDLLLHDSLQLKAYRSSQNFRSIWSAIIPELKEADIAYANLEGPTAHGVASGQRLVADPGRSFGTRRVYTGYPMFNYHPSLITDLILSGIDVVSTSNNHSLDRGSIGLERTIANLKSKSLPFTGTRINSQSQWYTVVRKNGLNVAFLGCTFGTNGMPDYKRQVLNCFNSNAVETIVKALKSSNQIDFIIVTPHWGVEYQTRPTRQQVTYAQRWLEVGADVILGAHPHMLQPIQKYTTRNGQEKLIIYSLANFVSAQRGASLYSAYVYFGLSKKGAQKWVNGYRYMPTLMTGVTSNPTLQMVSSPASAAGRFVQSVLGADRLATPWSKDQRTNFECP